jgi:hypothetical protein
VIRTTAEAVINESSTMQRRDLFQRVAAAAAILALAGLGGCAATGTVSSEVSTFGTWPAGRAPGRYAFERLPSQQGHEPESEALEASARAGLAKAGFLPVETGQQADVVVQLGAQDSAIALPLWDDPLWWHGGFGRRGPWLMPGWGVGVRGYHGSFGLYGPYGAYRIDRYSRQVALLIRDRATGQPLFEARAVSEGGTRSRPALLSALFEAALKDFPKLGTNPRTVDVVMPG